jgi:hypothetical protein
MSSLYNHFARTAQETPYATVPLLLQAWERVYRADPLAAAIYSSL